MRACVRACVSGSFYTLSTSKAIFRARTFIQSPYLFGHVTMIINADDDDDDDDYGVMIKINRK